MKNAVRIYDFNLSANGMQDFPVTGHYFRIISATGAVSVRLDSGDVVGPILEGQGLRNRSFNRLQISDASGYSNSGQLIVANSDFVDERKIVTTGAATDFPYSYSDAGQAYVTRHTTYTAPAATFGLVQLYNPTSSGKKAAVTRIRSNAAGASMAVIGSAGIQLANALENPSPLKIGSTASALQVRSGNQATATIASALVDLTTAPTSDFIFDDPVILMPGYDVSVINTNAASALNVQFFFHEHSFTASASNRDQYFGYVSLLLHFNGTNGSSTFTDSSATARTPALVVGTPTIDTGNSKYGTGGGKFVAASTCGIDYTTDANLRPFYQPVSGLVYSCVECWFKTTSSTAGQRIVSHMDGAFNNGAWAITMGNNYAGGLAFYYRPFNAATWMLATASGAYNDGNWHHIAVTLAANVFTLWVDGVSKATQAFTASATISTTNLSVGRDNNFGLYFDGWLDDVRITRSDVNAGGNVGTSRYTTTFTLPTAQFPDSP